MSNALGLPLKVYDYTSAYKNANKSCFGSQLDWLKFCAEKKTYAKAICIPKCI